MSPPDPTPAASTDQPTPQRLTRDEQATLLAERYRLLFAEGQIVELRALHVQRGKGRPHIEAGFFHTDHLKEMAQIALDVTPHARGVYFTLNPLNPDIVARRCNRIDWAQEGELSKDKDVIARRWLLIDADPVRDAHVSSTDQEKAHALDTARAVREFLRSKSWPEPILSDSGNGYHLLYRVDLPASDGGLVEGILRGLAAKFDTDQVKIDQSVFNASRICKVPGTIARKGDHVPSRPHRRAKLLEVPPA